MGLLEAIIFRRLMKQYLPGFRVDVESMSGSDVMQALDVALYSANETIKETPVPYRKLLELEHFAGEYFTDNLTDELTPFP